MIAYHGNPELKTQMVALAHEHQRLDRVVRGAYGRLGKQGEWTGGCAVGCTLESARQLTGDAAVDHSDHAAYERYLGIPTVLARLEDGIFEGLPLDEALTWPVRFLEAVPVGADLSMVWPRFAVWLMDDLVTSTINPDVVAAAARVQALYRRWVDGDKPGRDEWFSAAEAAYAAYAAATAAYAAGAEAAEAASADSAYAAGDAADSAARSRQASALLDIMASAPVPR